MKEIDLSEFGLDKNQSKTYLTMIEIGPSSILEIARKSGINRSMLYEIMDSLITVGLVQKSVRGKKLRFVAREPETLQLLLEQKLDRFEKLLPDIKMLARTGSAKPAIALSEGLAGIKQVYLRAIYSKEKRLYAFVGVESLMSKTKVLEKFWDEEFKKERRKRNIFGQVIAPNNTVGRKFQSKDNQNYRESKLVNAELYNFPAEILMYDNVVAFISYTQHEEYAAEIKSPAIAETLKMVWRFMWNENKDEN